MGLSTVRLTVVANASNNRRMEEIAAFIARCDAYRLSLEPPVSRARMGTILFSDARKLDALEAGADIGARRLAKATRALNGLEYARDHAAGALA